VNERNYLIIFHKTMLGEHNAIKTILPFLEVKFQMGLKYLWFNLKANEYVFRDWILIYRKI